jgi:hypothetical protein
MAPRPFTLTTAFIQLDNAPPVTDGRIPAATYGFGWELGLGHIPSGRLTAMPLADGPASARSGSELLCL